MVVSPVVPILIFTTAVVRITVPKTLCLGMAETDKGVFGRLAVGIRGEMEAISSTTYLVPMLRPSAADNEVCSVTITNQP